MQQQGRQWCMPLPAPAANLLISALILQPLPSWRQLRALALGSKTSCMSVSGVLTECTQLACNGPAEMRSAW